MARLLSRSVALIVILCFTFVSVTSCAIPKVAKEHPTAAGAAAGGVIGGVAGGAAGAAFGGTKGAIIGAVAGAVVGAVAGGWIGAKYSAKKVKSAEETAKAEGVAPVKAAAPAAKPGEVKPAAATTAAAEPAKATVVKMKAIEIEPAPVGPGDTVKINFIYALVTPADPKAKLLVEETRAITYKGEEIGTVTFAKEHENGTWKSTVPLALSSQAEPGTYTVTAKLKAGEEVAADSTTFEVQKRF
jgi:hypothetical protein